MRAEEKSEKEKRDTKAAKAKVAAPVGIKKLNAKEQKSALKRRRRALLKQGMKYEVRRAPVQTTALRCCSANASIPTSTTGTSEQLCRKS